MQEKILLFIRYPWVLPTYYYKDIQEVISLIPQQILDLLEVKVKESAK
ncbi:MAG TPA: hypothetical protein VNS32_25785 [Flavisolibacter sp.]|nr:hypothetical protein [Flavisolibacter sp.]